MDSCEEREARLKKIIVDKFAIAEDKILFTSDLVEDLGLDSLDQVELGMEVEDAFHIEIPDADFEKLKTLKDICDYLKDKDMHNGITN